MRDLLGGPVGGPGLQSRYSVHTFAADFRGFKKILTNLLSKASVVGQGLSRHLTVAGIFVPQPSVQMGLSLVKRRVTRHLVF